MSDKNPTWKKFTIICHRCGRHEDEGVEVSINNNGILQIDCPCGQNEDNYMNFGKGFSQ